MTGEFRHYPDNEPLPKGAELEPAVVEQFTQEVERLAKPDWEGGTQSDYLGARWYRDVVTNALILVTRQWSPHGIRELNMYTVTVHEVPEPQGADDLAQISRSYFLDTSRPAAAEAKTELHSYSQSTHRETYDPSNIKGLPDPTWDELSFFDKQRAQVARTARSEEQRKNEVHLSQLPPVGTANQEFADVIPILQRLESENEISEYYIHNRPFRLEPEE